MKTFYEKCVTFYENFESKFDENSGFHIFAPLRRTFLEFGWLSQSISWVSGMFEKVVLRALLASRKKNNHRESFRSLLQLGDLIANFRTYFGVSVQTKQVLIRCIYRYKARKLTPYRSLTSFPGRQGENHEKS